MRKLKNDLSVEGTSALDLSVVFSDRTLSQNALVAIGGVPHLIGGVYTSRALSTPGVMSDIYAVPLSANLANVAGEAIPLVQGPRWVFKSTAAVVEDDLLYINCQALVLGNASQRVAVFDIKRDFAEVAHVELFTAPLQTVAANHTTIAVKGNLVFGLYPEAAGVIEAKVFAWE